MGYPLNAYGLAARSDRDGIDVLGFPHGPWGKAPDVEDIESEFPLLHLYQKQQRDTCGYGKYRGGLGAAVGYVVHQTPHLGVHLEPEGVEVPRAQRPVRGLLDDRGAGHPGSWRRRARVAWRPASRAAHRRLRRWPSAQTALGGEVDRRAPDARASACVQEGDVLAASTQGSGGYGDVLERDPARGGRGRPGRPDQRLDRARGVRGRSTTPRRSSSTRRRPGELRQAPERGGWRTRGPTPSSSPTGSRGGPPSRC